MDRHFFIKTISKREYELYEEIWPKLKQKMMSGTSFLPPVVCLFVENTHGNIGYLVMKNLFLGISGPAFDLKGRKKTMAAGMTTGCDDEFVADFPGGILLEKRDRDHLLSKLKADIKELSGLGLYDYSLLLSAEKLPNKDHEAQTVGDRLLGKTPLGTLWAVKVCLLDVLTEGVGTTGFNLYTSSTSTYNLNNVIFPDPEGKSAETVPGFDRLHLHNKDDGNSSGPSGSGSKASGGRRSKNSHPKNLKITDF
ncbi:unnamed protein product, partial [Mesorhabditis spiculigera]